MGVPLQQRPVVLGSPGKEWGDTSQRKGFCFQCISQILGAAAKNADFISTAKINCSGVFIFNSSLIHVNTAKHILHYPNAISQPQVELPSCYGVEMGSGSLGSWSYYTKFKA